MPTMERFWKGLAHLQFRRAGVGIVGALLLSALSVPAILDLGLDSSWTALLPEDKPSIRDLQRIEGRIGGLSTLTVAIQSKDVEAMQRFARALVPRIERLEDHRVRSVDWNIAAYEDFVHAHRHLYVELGELKEIQEALQERLDWERARANPFFVSLEDTSPPNFESIVERFRAQGERRRKKIERFPGGFYLHPDRDLLALFVRTDIPGGDAKSASALIAAINREAQALKPESYAPDLEIEFAGSLVVAREEHEAIAQELLLATALTISGVLLAIWIFFRRFRAIPLLGGALGPPVLLTFAFAEFAVDSLNTSTAFLGSIVIGNGINPNIIWLARFFEARRRGIAIEASVRESHTATWAATLTASLAAAIAYGSLTITDFRGFRDFGVIGAVGMVLCWFGAFLLLPCFAVVVERLRPLRAETARASRNLYGVLFSSVVQRAPRSILAISAVLGAMSVGVVAYAIVHDPIEYDFRRLKSEREGSTRARQLNDRVGEIVGGSEQGNSIAMLAESRAQARELEMQLERRKDHGAVPYKTIHTIDDLLPRRQREKIPVIAEIRESLLELRGFADEPQRENIDKYLPPESVMPVSAQDLPEAVARPFTERDGTRGRILFIEKRDGVSIWDGRFLVEWADVLRRVRAPDGSRPPLAGRAPIFADMIEVIWVDGPKAIVASFLATLLLVAFAFRRALQRALTMGALLLGIAWMGALMALLGMRLNFLNFVAFPITFGNGVDYGVNVMRRYALDAPRLGAEAVRSAVEQTGGAVILCSLTTIIGYTSLYTSANQALNSFGLAMAISEVTCLIAAVLVLPSALFVCQQRGPSSGRQPNL